jgi:putative CocE/NonD family hydrolase
MRRIVLSVLALLLSAAIPAATLPRSNSLYVPMPDGTPIAVTVHLPSDLKAGERLPVLMRTTRYWREFQPGPALRPLIKLHLLPADCLVGHDVKYLNRRHFAVVLVDARGSGASGGHRVVEYSPQEIADMGDVAAWSAQQPWSNGRIGTFGISYEANTAELAAVPNQPAIRAVMPLFGTFDNLENLSVGGVGFQSFLQQWEKIVRALDHNDVCNAAQAKGFRCWVYRMGIGGVLPVDGDSGGRQLGLMQQQHHNWDVAQAIKAVEYRDDRMPTENGSLTNEDFSPYAMRRQIEASKVPMMVWGSWLDGDAEGNLVRYRTFSNREILIIGALSHGGDYNVDPFATKHHPPAPPEDEQLRMQADFFDDVLRSEFPNDIQSSIRYYTMGEGQWHTTDVWPPKGLSSQRLYLHENHALLPNVPADTNAYDAYTVDFSATAGKRTRWDTGLGGGDVVYPDRATEDRKLLVYTGEPLSADLEITGTPIVTIQLATTASDGAIHAYLEDVSPEGRVTYVNEGDFRLIDRKEVDPLTLPYPSLGPAHSLMREDALPMTPGVPATIHFAMYPTSVLLRKGHRIRVALAGADAGFFQRYPPQGTPTWSVFRDAQRASSIDLPVREDAIP